MRLLRRKKKDNTVEVIQQAVRQELDRRELEYDDKSKKEQEKLRKQRLWANLPLSKKMQLIHRMKRGAK